MTTLSHKKPVTPLDEGDGFQPDPYVMLSVDSMRKVLNEIPESRW